MKIIYVIFFATIIVLSNYLFQYQINNWLTWGALLFPVSFLLTDVLGEKESKKVALQVVGWGICLAVIPTLFLVDIRIAVASISAYFIAQFTDVYIFSYFKNRYESKWWIRNNVSTFISQFLDTIVFLFIAFYGIIDNKILLSLVTGTIGIKWIIALLDTPIFYIMIRKKYD